MRAEIIPITTVPRKSRQQRDSDAALGGFEKALALIHSLNCKTTINQRATVESMAIEGVLSEEEKRAVDQYFGWERAK